MRLISFAIVSLLAITVSAYPVSDAPHQSTATQSALRHQSTGTPGAQPPRSALAQKVQRQLDDRARGLREHQRKAFVSEVEMLREQLQNKQDLINKLEARSRAMGRRLKELEGVANALDEGSPEQNEVIATLSSRMTDAEKARKALIIERKELKEIRDDYDNAKQKLDRLNATRQ
ncbi:hypothetical protein BASA50_006219 [Batrachochytrium salamandrivorans]|uniref:Uncharacterized protein n=1 Tax=Batrachochytrium salamandrivorans TaxID=1357716 RepID=A0ABQ8FDK4_9FUNG|nr:hypothetical protein BASA50_006219 [Batrachochytrium salamandrivorans]KAH9249185.1 hypothetical protein BASA81_013084 [Batrachochytrium salamandrivorans]